MLLLLPVIIYFSLLAGCDDVGGVVPSFVGAVSSALPASDLSGDETFALSG